MKTATLRCRAILFATLVSLGATANCRTSAGGSSAAENASAETASAPSKLPREHTTGQLEVVATFDTLEPGGIAVSPEGRIFVSFPRYDPGVPYTVAELVAGEPKPYPGRRINDRDRDEPGRHFLSAESLTIGPTGDLWILDSGRPDFEPTLPRGAKLLRIDLETDDILRTYVFPAKIARETSLLADVRIEMRHGENGFAYITDASPSGFNGLVVVDLASGQAWRKLDLHPSTRADTEFVGIVEGRRFLFDPAGQPASPLSLGANGLALDPDGERLFFRPLAGRELYSVRLDALVDRTRPAGRVEDSLRRYGNQGFASDGLAADDEGRLYLTNYEDNAVMRGQPPGPIETLVHDPRLLWPDALAVTEGALYIVTNQTHREGVFNDGENRVERPLVLFRTPIDAGPVRLQ